jgi:hypothetical protein
MKQIMFFMFALILCLCACEEVAPSYVDDVQGSSMYDVPGSSVYGAQGRSCSAEQPTSSSSYQSTRPNPGHVFREADEPDPFEETIRLQCRKVVKEVTEKLGGIITYDNGQYYMIMHDNIDIKSDKYKQMCNDVREYLTNVLGFVDKVASFCMGHSNMFCSE